MSRLLCWANEERLLIEDGQIFHLSYEKTQGEDVSIYRHQYPADGGWGSDNGKVVLYFKRELNIDQDFKFVRDVELPTGKTVQFVSKSYRHGTHIADIVFYQFAFIDGKCTSWRSSSPWDNPDRDFANWQANVLAKQCVVI
jgi:hypothetical protein